MENMGFLYGTYGGTDCRKVMTQIAPAEGYCFTLDDNIRFLEESTLSGATSIFDHPYMRLFQEMHLRYNAKFQFNMFYSYTPDGFSLADVPDCWRNELEANADWMRFSFHARYNDPPFPYEQSTAEEIRKDYCDVMRHIQRIAGKAATNSTTTLHYVCTTKQACIALKKCGIRGLIGMFYPMEGREALRYYLTPEQADQVREKSFWEDPETGLVFVRNDMVLNTVDLGHIRSELARDKKIFYQVMIHEQYFYQDYVHYQPDFTAKVEAALAYFTEIGLSSYFLEDLI